MSQEDSSRSSGRGTRGRSPRRRPSVVAGASDRGDAAAEARERILEAVAAIPRGRVATYGQIAVLAGLPGRARLVGRVLSGLGVDDPLPWHRVVNAGGGISRRASPGLTEPLQRRLLEGEGIAFDQRGRLSLERWQWDEDR